jgi:dinuclear metal center YbgI/SA1388 family protein
MQNSLSCLPTHKKNFPMPCAPIPASGLLRRFVERFETQIASLRLAEPWDNVGMLVECPSESSSTSLRILTCIDLTNEVVDEAVEGKYNMIVSYHPVMFRPIQSLSVKSQLPILRCIEQSINIFVPHTALDTAPDGMNDYLCTVFGQHEISRIGIKDSSIPGFSVGRISKLEKPISLRAAIQLIKSKLGIERVRYASSYNLDESRIDSVGVCVGSGGSILTGCDADLLLTGEMTHHDILSVKASGKSVILLDHSSSERPFLPELARKLSELDEVETVSVSTADTEPIQVA